MKNKNLIFIVILCLIVYNSCEDSSDKDGGLFYEDFSLTDINPDSETYGQAIGLSFFNGKVSSYYFGDQGWGLCRNRFGGLHVLYNDLTNEGYEDIEMVGINGISFANEDLSGMIEGNTLPWLQDNDSEKIWDKWEVELRDFIIFDPDGNYYTKVNLTEIDPSIDHNYNNLKNLLIDALED